MAPLFARPSLLILLMASVLLPELAECSSDLEQHHQGEARLTDLTFTTGDITWNLAPIFIILGLLYLVRIGKARNQQTAMNIF